MTLREEAYYLGAGFKSKSLADHQFALCFVPRVPAIMS